MTPQVLGCFDCGFVAPYLEVECLVGADGIAHCPTAECGGILHIVRDSSTPLRDRIAVREADDVPMPEAFREFVLGLDLSELG